MSVALLIYISKFTYKHRVKIKGARHLRYRLLSGIKNGLILKLSHYYIIRVRIKWNVNDLASMVVHEEARLKNRKAHSVHP